jgi:hypothetical protein
MSPELLDCLSSRSGLRDQFHIGFGVDQRRYALTKKGMIINSENPDRSGAVAHELPAFCEIA